MSTTAIHPKLFVLFGCPGSGKGTFAQILKPQGYNHISTGDITREEVRNKTEFGLKYEYPILNHVIGGIPFKEIQKLVEERLQKATSERKGIILDGYPKTVEQCEFLDSFIQKNELNGKVVFVLLDIDENDALNRILSRQTCEKCDKIYNVKFSRSKKPDECDECHGKLSTRMDTNSDETKKRVYEFKSKMKSVIEYYASRNCLNTLDGNAAPNVCSKRFSNFHKSFSSYLNFRRKSL